MHTHMAGQTGGRSRLHWGALQMSSGGRRGAWGPELPVRGRCPLGASGPPQSAGVGPWRKTLSAARHWCPGDTRLRPGGPGRPPAHQGCGLPTTASSSCGIKFSTPFALRVSMPLGGKYKRCLCLKPNMGVRESPGLGPSFGPGLLAAEGWAETRGRPPLYAQRGSSACSSRCPGLRAGEGEA